MDISVALDGSKKRDLTFFSGDDMGITLTVYEHDGDASPITPADIRFTSGDGDYPYDETFTVPEAYIGRTSYRIIGEVDGLTTTLVYGILTTDAGWPWFTSSGTGGRAWGTKAENITIDDDGQYFSGDEVEEALQELGAGLRGVQTLDYGGVNVLNPIYGASTLGIMAAIAAADAAASATGRFVYFPGGTVYDVSGNSNQTVKWKGDGYSTRLRTSHATANIITVTGAFAETSDMRFESSVTRTGGWFVDVALGANRYVLRSFWMSGAIGGVRNSAVASVTVEDGRIFDSIAATGIPIRIDAGFDVSIRDIITDNSGQLFAGVYITNAGDVSVEDCQFIHAGNAMSVDVAATKNVNSLYCNNTFFDNSTRGALISSTGGTIARNKFDQCWFSSSTAQGVLLQASGGGVVNGTDFNFCDVFLNAGDGINIASVGVTNTQVNNCAISQNTAAGVSVAANVNDFAILNSRIGASHGLTGNASGIVVAVGTSDRYRILGNDLLGNTVTNLSDGGTGLVKAVANNLS